MLIGGLQKSSLIDYPGKISAIIFTQGCNFKCPYCHNPEIIKQDGATAKAVAPIFDFLESRKGKLDGVVITGGEPTLQNDLPEFIEHIKHIGFSVKLDTNGTNPDMLQRLIKNNLIDYIAMDIKAPIKKYPEITCSKVNTDNILKSIHLIMSSGIDYEFRTTVVKSQLAVNDFSLIGELISGAQKYYLQRFIPTKTVDSSFLSESTYSDEEFTPIIEVLKNRITNIYLR